MQIEYSLLFPPMENQITDNEVTFSIEYMKSREVCVVYHILHAYNPDGSEILINSKPVHIGERCVITTDWQKFYDTYNLSDDIINHASSFKIELRMIGVNDDNPCSFANCMFKNGEMGDYHEPSEIIKSARINFVNNAYVNLYPNENNNDNYLQVIRPNRDYFSTTTLRNSKCSVLAPHLADEVEEDKPVNVFMEYMYQVEQMTNIYHSGFKM